MREEDWQKVDEELSHIYGSVKLRCDGLELMLTLQPRSRFENAILIYVNGWMRGQWVLEDCEERRRFFCPSKRKLWDGKSRKTFAKAGKRTLKRLKIDPDAFITHYLPYWTSFGRMKAHLEKNNRVIELLG